MAFSKDQLRSYCLGSCNKDKSIRYHDNRMFFTKHANKQAQRRCIPIEAIELLLDYARIEPAGHGAERYHFDRRTWSQAAKALGPELRRREKFRNAYIIMADGRLVTAAWRY